MSKLFGTQIFKIICNHPQCTRNYSQKKGKQKKSDFIVIQAVPTDYPRIIKLFNKHFYPHEPTSRGLGIHLKTDPIMDDYLMTELSQGLSIIGVEKKSGNIAGASINMVSEKDTAHKLLEFSKCLQQKNISQFFELNAYICAVPHLYKKYGVDTIYEIGYVAVDSRYRGKGLAHTLMQRSLKLGHSKGFNIVRVDATNVITAKICRKLGMEKVCEIPFDLYVDNDKKPILKIEHPDVSCQVFVHKCKK